jgi:hypothetical protein
VFGLGMALTVAPLTTTVMNAVEVTHAGVASGVNNAVSRAAGLLAIALMTLPLIQVFHSRLERRLLGRGTRPALVAAMQERSAMLAGAESPAEATPREAAAIRQAVAESFVDGFRRVVLAAAGLALAASVTAAITLGKPQPEPPN